MKVFDLINVPPGWKSSLDGLENNGNNSDGIVTRRLPLLAASALDAANWPMASSAVGGAVRLTPPSARLPMRYTAFSLLTFFMRQHGLYVLHNKELRLDFRALW